LVTAVLEASARHYQTPLSKTVVSEMLRGTRFPRKAVMLSADIRDWIDTWNENPRPFAWTKTAEEILNSLAEYITRISGGSH
jgi:hypothetical protein